MPIFTKIIEKRETKRKLKMEKEISYLIDKFNLRHPEYKDELIGFSPADDELQFVLRGTVTKTTLEELKSMPSCYYDDNVFTLSRQEIEILNELAFMDKIIKNYKNQNIE